MKYTNFLLAILIFFASCTSTPTIHSDIIKAVPGQKVMIYVKNEIMQETVVANDPTKGFITLQEADGSQIHLTYSRMNEIYLPPHDYTEHTNLPMPFWQILLIVAAFILIVYILITYWWVKHI